MSEKELKNPIITFAEELPCFYSRGTYTEVKGTKEEYEFGLQKRLIAKEDDCCDIEWYRWPKTDAPLDECIKIDVDGYNIGAPNPMIAKINYFNKPGDSDYTFVTFPVHLREKDYLAEICYFEVGDDFLSFEMLSKTSKVKLAGTNLSISIPNASKPRPIPQEEKEKEGFILSYENREDWLPAMEVYVWEKDGDLNHFKDYISNRFVLKNAEEKAIKLANKKELNGMILQYETDASLNSDSNIEWILDLGDKYASIRFTFPHNFTYMEVVARGIFSSLNLND